MKQSLWLAVVLFVACGGGWVGGIHARLAWSEARGLRVTEVPSGSASRAGLLANDRVIAIDGESVSGLTQAEVVERLRGPVGSRVRLDVLRGDEPLSFEIERAPYESP